MAQDMTSNVFDTALIFEGGGLRASYHLRIGQHATRKRYLL